MTEEVDDLTMELESARRKMAALKQKDASSAAVPFPSPKAAKMEQQMNGAAKDRREEEGKAELEEARVRYLVPG